MQRKEKYIPEYVPECVSTNGQTLTSERRRKVEEAYAEHTTASESFRSMFNAKTDTYSDPWSGYEDDLQKKRQEYETARNHFVAVTKEQGADITFRTQLRYAPEETTKKSQQSSLSLSGIFSCGTCCDDDAKETSQKKGYSRF